MNPQSITSRLPLPWGTWINREKPIVFSFDGKSVHGFEGDCVASALAGEQRWLLSRSFKYHRPRGAFSMAGQDSNTLVHLPGAPNSLADCSAIVQGLDVRPQNCNGSLEHDPGAILGLFARFLPVGFYYRAFFRPAGV